MRPAPLGLTTNQWKVVCLCALGGMLETMDIYIIAFVLADITGPWKLSYGKSAIILFASGVGSVIGSFFWGYIADRVGRSKAYAGTIFLCSAASLALTFTPTGDWIFLAAMRAVIGFGAAGFFLFVLIVQEFAPAANRGFASSIVSAAAACGLLLGSLFGSFLMPVLGWRGMFGMGALPVLLGVAVLFYLPESPRWALAHGQAALGRRSLLWALGPTADIDTIEKSYVAQVNEQARKPAWRELFAQRRSVIVGTCVNFGVVTGYYGITLWAPTLLALLLAISGAQAARIMIAFSLTGLLSRLMMGLLADRFGRRRCGAAAALGAALLLVLAGFVGRGDLFGSGLFWLPFGLAFVLADSGFAIMGMYTSELFPSRLRGRGCGLSYAAGSVGKIVGPLGLALLIGSSNLIRPQATAGSLLAAFSYLAAMFVLAGLTYLLIARETRGRTLEELERRLA